jgi:predicted lipoprotein with Yx(FWY)xxD motif
VKEIRATDGDVHPFDHDERRDGITMPGGSRRIGALAIAAACAAAFAVGATGSVRVHATVSLANNSTLGEILVGSTGRTLYHFTGDHGKKVACTAACAAQWPPVLVAKNAKPVAGAGAKASKLGTLTRPDGKVQVTYNGLTLYRFAGDTKNGQVNGQTLEGKWFALSGAGALVKINPSSATSSGSTSSGSSSSSSSSGSSTDTSGSDGGYDY